MYGSIHRQARNVLIVGTERPARDIAEMIESYIWAGLQVIGFVSTSEPPAAPSDHLPVLGTLRELRTIVPREGIDEVIIAVERNPEFELRDLVSLLESLSVNIRLVPNYFDLAFLRVQIEDFSGIPLLTLKEPVLSPYQRFVKRLFDVVVTGCLLVPAIPMMAVIAILIKLDDHGPILFRQPRMGEGGVIFTMLKFRTMYVGAEKDLPKVLQVDESGHVVHKHRDDPRVTRIGRFLRKTSLDELPQFLNIMRGEMSLVGPRPELPDLVDKYEFWQRKRFEVPQGLTGWWQVNGRSDKPMHLNTEADLFYIRNYSVWLDIKIVVRTAGAILSARGAF